MRTTEVLVEPTRRAKAGLAKGVMTANATAAVGMEKNPSADRGGHVAVEHGQHHCPQPVTGTPATDTMQSTLRP